MRRKISMMSDWLFTGPDRTTAAVDLPHTWNAVDGQDGGNDYWRGTCTYRHGFTTPVIGPGEEVYLEFCGVNASADVYVNGQKIGHHDGGYSTFRMNVTKFLQYDMRGEAAGGVCSSEPGNSASGSDRTDMPENELLVYVDNSVNDRVYPQKADFTFYGGIYREVSLLIVPGEHFELEYYGTPGIRITPVVKEDGSAEITVDTFRRKKDLQTVVILEDADAGPVRAEKIRSELEEVIDEEDGDGYVITSPIYRDRTVWTLRDPHLWNGRKDPYLYRARVLLLPSAESAKEDPEGILDEVSASFGIRSFRVDPKKGFFLNGKSYPLHGVSRHQDRKGIGNALTQQMHAEDMSLIREMGANTIRLAHYQHDQYFYDLCDREGMIVWAEIPYISEHMKNGRANTISQMKELIIQNYNHPSIVCWGVSNEITISTKDKKDMLDNHRVLNNLCHRMDKTRFTTLACYAMCGPFNPVAHLTDVVSWNLYLGWYIPGLFLNDLWLSFFHLVYPNRALGYSEYGAEAMTNLHSGKAKRGDHSEEYQCLYHEYMLRCFAKRPWMWATHVWNMFDFAADARNQGGEPGMNHKGLVTFDRKTKKDSFYLYKAWWSDEPFVHLSGKRYADRVEPVTIIKVYSNQSKVALYKDGTLVEEKNGEHVFEFIVPMAAAKEAHFRAEAGDCFDEMMIRNVVSANPAYLLREIKKQKSNWV